MTMTMQESATRHMAAGVMDLDELERLVEQDTGKAPKRKGLSDCRSHFRRYGIDWVDAMREANRRRQADNPERHRESTRRWKAENPEAGRRWYAENTERHRENTRRWIAENPARQLLNRCRGSAKQRGHECTITVEMIEKMLVPMVCSVTGLPLSLEHGGESARNPWAPSIDRLDCSKGYVPGNVRMVCALYNLARNDFPDEDFMKVVKALAARAP